MRIFVLLTLTIGALGCVTVKPWQKEILAQPHMRLDPSPLSSSFVRHVYESKEASSRGHSAGGGGCGCN